MLHLFYYDKSKFKLQIYKCTVYKKLNCENNLNSRNNVHKNE